MTSKTTDDEFEGIDAEFEAAIKKVGRCLEANSPITDEIEHAADRMFDIAIQTGDRVMMMFCFASFSRFIEQHRSPPWTMLEQVHDAFRRYGLDGFESIDAAFGLKQHKKGQPSRWTKRVQDRFKGRLIEALVKLLGVNKARETVEEMFDEPDLRRTHSKYRRIVKSK